MSVTTVNLGKIRINWRGAFVSTTAYTVNDAVSYGGSSYICVIGYTSTSSFPTDLGAGYWQLMAQGSSVNTTTGDITYRGNSGSDIRLPIGSSGQNLTVSNAGLLAWEYPGKAGADYYVSPNGSDSNDGSTLTRAFRTVRYACANITGPATLYIKAGTYNETLPITVPASVTIVGDGMRDTIISPLVGNYSTNYTSSGSSGTTLKVASTTNLATGMTITGTGFVSAQKIVTVVDSTTLTISANPDTTPSGTLTFTYLSTDASPVPNQNSTMFLLSNETMMSGLLMIGMTGFVPSGAYPTDYTQATVKGVFLRLNPASPISTKSPYIKDCTAKSSGGVGAIVDGSVHASGNRSMLFWAYNQVHDGGVGLVVCNLGKAEAVSCFTYYCYFGYFTYGGGIIRSLSGNNSYGTYGCVSQGYDSTESPVTATVYGNMLTFIQAASTGTFTQGELITQATSGATARVTSVQSGYLYYKQTTGTFNTSNLITGGSSGATMTPTADTGQNNYLYVLNSLSAAPTVGASIQFAGDSNAYVIQAVSTATINLVPVTIITLAQQKITASTDSTAVTIRYNFSNIRLTGHDFLSIGTGGVTTTNYPGIATQAADPAKQTIWTFPGRIYYVSTDQSGNFSVGQYFSVNQATGAATLNASAFNLSGLTSLRLGTIGAQLGAQVNEFSTDGTLSQNSAVKVPTQSAVTTYLGAAYQNFSPAVDTVVTTATASSGTSITVGTTVGMVVNMTAVFGANLGNIVAGTVYYILTASGTTITVALAPGGSAFTVGTTVSQSVAVNTGFSLGDAGHRWSHLYVGPGSITIGSLTISDNAGTLQVQASGANAPANINAIQNGTSNVTVANNGSVTITGGGNLGLTVDSSGNATFAGTLTVSGTTTTINSTTLVVNDKNIELAKVVTPTDTTASGAGITIKGATDKILQWTASATNGSSNTGYFSSTDNFNLGASGLSYYINGTSALSASVILGSAVTPTLGGNSTTGITLGGTALTSVQIGSNTTAANTVTVGGAITGNAVKIASTTGGTIALSTDVTTGTINEWSSITTGTVNFANAITTGTINIAGGSGAAAVNIGNASGTTTVKGNLVVDSGKTFAIKGSSSGSVTFQAASAAGSVTYTLPSADAAVSGYALTSNASGTLSWAAAGATISDDSSTTTLYPTMSTATSGSLTTAKISSSKFTFNASTGNLSATQLTGTLQTAAQTNITSVGTLTGLTVAGNLTNYASSAGATVVVFGNARTNDYTWMDYNSYPGASDGYTIGGRRAYSSLTGSKVQVGTEQFMKEGSGTDNKTAWNLSLHNGTSIGVVLACTSSGNLTVTGTITSNSDARLKTNVETITTALDKVVALRGVMFDRIATGAREMGVIAQEVEAVIPELVFTDENGIKSVAYANTVALLIEAIKEQQVQINELKGKL